MATRPLSDSLEHAEQAALGAMLRTPRAIPEVLRLLAEDDFAADRHRRTFASLVGLWEAGRPVDLVTLADAMHDSGALADAGGYPALAALWEAAPTPSQAEHYAGIVRDRSLLRRLALAAGEILRDAENPPGNAEEVLGQAERRILEVARLGLAGDAVPLAKAVDEAYEAMEARQRRGDGTAGLPTGWRDLDSLTAGLQPGELVLVAARPSCGKTSWGLGLARNLAVRRNVPTFFVSLEQSRRELAERLLCAEASIDSMKLRRGYLSSNDADAITEAGNRLRQAPLFLDDSPVQTALRVAANARRMQSRHAIRAVVLDYVQLVAPEDPRAPRHEQVGAVSRRLKQLARELSVPVIAMAQLNRSADERPNQRPRLSQLRESGALEQDADAVLILHKPEGQPDPLAALVEVAVAKQRNGPTGEVTLVYRKPFMRFEDYASGRASADGFPRVAQTAEGDTWLDD